MKLRIRGNSVRVRLTQHEVSRIAAGRRVEQKTRFSASAWLASSVEPSLRVETPLARFDGVSLAIVLPAEQARQWASSDQVGIEAVQPTGDEEPLRIIVEKDFECLHSSEEKTEDAFPNPARV